MVDEISRLIGVQPKGTSAPTLIRLLRYVRTFDGKGCEASVPEISKCTGIADRSIRRAITAAEQIGVLKVVRRPLQPSVLFVCDDGLSRLIASQEPEWISLMRSAVGAARSHGASEQEIAEMIAKIGGEGIAAALKSDLGVKDAPKPVARVASEPPRASRTGLLFEDALSNEEKIVDRTKPFEDMEVTKVLFTRMSNSRRDRTMKMLQKILVSSSGNEEQFEQFWTSYPKHKRNAKDKVAKEWKAVIAKLSKIDSPSDEGWAKWLIKRAAEYAESPVGKCKYAKSPEAWLNGGHYHDDPAAWSRGDDKAPVLQSSIYTPERAREAIKKGKDRNRL